MNLDEQSVGTHRHCPTTKRNHEIRASATLAGIHNDWQMRFLLGGSDGRRLGGYADDKGTDIAVDDAGHVYSEGEAFVPTVHAATDCPATASIPGWS